MVTHPSTFYLLIVINTHSSFIRGAYALLTFECGYLYGEPFECHRKQRSATAACNIYLMKKSYVD